MGMQYLAASSRRSVAFGIIFTVALMVLSFLAVLSATKVQAQSSGCPGADNVATFTGRQNQTTESFRIRGDRFRLAFDIQGSGGLDVAVLDEDGRVEDSFEVSGDDTEIIDLGPGTFRLEIRERNNNVSSYEVDVDDCLEERDSNPQDTTNQNQTTTSQNQQTTTSQNTTAETTAADANLNAAANRPDSGSFRCELFLRTVRDDTGALRAQYQGNEQIVQRFEQCLSEDVLAATIPDRNLPFTGGPSLPVGGGVLLLVAAALLAGRIIRR
jgi:hypothetical protein